MYRNQITKSDREALSETIANDVERAKNAVYLLPRGIEEDESCISLELHLCSVDGKGPNGNDSVTVLQIENVGLMLKVLQSLLGMWEGDEFSTATKKLKRKALQHLKGHGIDSREYAA